MLIQSLDAFCCESVTTSSGSSLLTPAADPWCDDNKAVLASASVSASSESETEYNKLHVQTSDSLIRPHLGITIYLKV